MSIQQRIKRLEISLAGKKKPMPTVFKVAFMGDGRGEERVKKIQEEYFSMNNTYEGLTIIRSNVPLPAPPPSDEMLRQIWGERDG